MSKARTLANLISDNAELADGQISVAEVVGAAPTASPTFTGNIGAAGNITNASGNLTLDVAGDIKLDADSSNIYLADGGTDIGLLSTNNQDLNIRNLISNKDIYFQGNDGGSVITALTLDMSDGGAATFNAGITLTGTLNVDSSTTNGFLSAGSNILNFGTTSNDTLAFYANNTNHMKLKPDGEVIINETGSAEGDLRVESDNNSHMLFVDAGNNRIGIGKSDPARTLDIHGSMEISVNTASHETFLFTTQAANDAKLMMQNASATTAVQLSANGTTFFNGGRVGIGAGASPATTLHVANTTEDPYVLVDGSGGNRDSGYKINAGAGVKTAIRADVGGSLIYGHENQMVFTSSAVIFNEASANIDFRVESDSNSHMLFVDGGTNGVGINGTPYTNFAASSFGHLVFGNSYSTDGTGDVKNSGISWPSAASGNQVISSLINASQDGNYGAIIQFHTRGSGGGNLVERMRIDQSQVTINEDSRDQDFRVESDSNAHAIFVDGNNNSVAVGTNNTEGATTNFMPLVAGRFATKWGTALNLAVNTWVTIYTFEANAGNFIVSARGSGTGNIEDNTTGIAHIQNGPSSKYTDLLLGNRCDLRMSGANLQVYQSIFTGANISWSVMRICN